MTATGGRPGARRRSVWIVLLVVSVVIIIAAAIYPLPRWILSRSGDDWKRLSSSERYGFEATLRASLLQGVAGLLVVLGAVTGVRQLEIARRQAEALRRTQLVDAFTKAVAQLMEGTSAARVAGVYALDRFLDVNPDELERVMGVLSRFIRDESGDAASFGAVELALRCLSKHKEALPVLDITGACLRGRRLVDLQLQGAVLSGCDLRDADLTNTDLREADLRGAYMQRAVLKGANLIGAKLADAHLAEVVTDGGTQVALPTEEST